MSIIFKQAVWEEAVRRSLVAVRRADQSKRLAIRCLLAAGMGQEVTTGLRKRRSCSSACLGKKLQQQWGDGALTLQALLFASKSVPAMKASSFFCSNTADKVASSHRNSRGTELQLGTVPCSSAMVTVPSCWTAPALRVGGHRRHPAPEAAALRG